MPEIIIEDDARRYIKDISFDQEAYYNYLSDDRQMTDENIDNISLVFTNKGVRAGAIANTLPGFLNGGKHIVTISPTRLPADIHQQGRILRHETEHVIQGCTWTYKAWAAGQFSFIGTSALGTGALFAHRVSEATETLPDAARIALSSVAAIGSFATAAMISSNIGKLFNPLEFGASIAERRYINRLPDGVLIVDR